MMETLVDYLGVEDRAFNKILERIIRQKESISHE